MSDRTWNCELTTGLGDPSPHEHSDLPTPRITYYRLFYKGMYYYDYSPHTGSVWVLSNTSCAILNDAEILVALALLTKVEGLSNKDLEIQRMVG